MLAVPIALSNAPASVVSASLSGPRARSRVVLVASPDSSLRERLRQSLTGLRWQVLEAPGGAEAWVASQDAGHLEALLIDSWLPDLDVSEFLTDFHQEHPHVDLMTTDGAAVDGSPRSPYHQELLYALRRSQESDTAAWQSAPNLDPGPREAASLAFAGRPATQAWQRQTTSPAILRSAANPVAVKQAGTNQAGANQTGASQTGASQTGATPAFGAAKAIRFAHPDAAAANDSTAANQPAPWPLAASASVPGTAIRRDGPAVERIPELIGTSSSMLEVSRRIRLVAGRSTPVLIEGPTGSGKELVAEALHRLSNRNRKPFVAINCAAIPEALLEAELFGHTRGAFTGAVQGRTGRIEAADGGTLFLDEIGEMPLGLQSKLLRFFESGELQRIGDNEIIKVDVRIVAATHQPLAEDAQKGLFRADLYYRLAVFLIRTPSLIERMEDLPQLVSHFVERMGRKSPVKRIDPSAMNQLATHSWPGNVRELEHVLERAAILAGDEPLITSAEIDFGLSLLD